MDRLKTIPLAIIETRWSFEKQKLAPKKGRSQPNNFGWIFYFSPGSCPQNRWNFSGIDRLSSLIMSSIDSCS